MSLLLVNVNAYVGGRFVPAEILLKEGRIARVDLADDESRRFRRARRNELSEGSAQERPGILDCRGLWLVPSFSDAHLHLETLAECFEGADLSTARQPGDIARALGRIESGLDDDQWLIGWGWNPNLWDWPEALSRETLDRVFPGRPVVVKTMDLHSVVLNTRALSLVDIDVDDCCHGESSRKAAGGRIERDGRGGLTGRLFERAAWTALEAKPPLSAGALVSLVERAVAALNAKGVTAVIDYDGSKAAAIVESSGLNLRVMKSIRREEAGDGRIDIPYDRRSLWIAGDGGIARSANGPLKLFADGALSSRTALLEDDYENRPGDRGIALADFDDLRELMCRADRAGRPVAVHAIGDRANRLVTEIFESLPRGRCAERGHRIEHAQHLSKGLPARMAALGLIASVQPIHLSFDIVSALDCLGARGARIHVLKDLLEAGVSLAFGSDAPVAPADPLANIYWAVTRSAAENRSVNGLLRTRLKHRGDVAISLAERRSCGTTTLEAAEGYSSCTSFESAPGFYAEQRITALQALHAVTAGAAGAMFARSFWGSIEQGLSADLALLSANPLDIGRADAALPVVTTVWFEGKQVFARSGWNY